MKKPIYVLALLGAFANTAFAQTNVTISGVADAAIARTDTNATAPVWALASGQHSGSRLGFRGYEDLGGGMSAIFTLENGYNIDTGSLGQSGRIFGRQAFVGLSSKTWGKLTFGRQYQLNHPALTMLDPFGTNLAGNTENSIPGAGARPYFIAGNVTGTASPDIRIDNSIVYQTNNLDGFTGALQFGLGEQAGAFANGRLVGASATYIKGPIEGVATYLNSRSATGTVEHTSYLIGGTYKFPFAQFHAAYQDNDIDAGRTAIEYRTYLIGATVPVGSGEVLASWIRADDKNTAATSDQYALGYIHPLSKRTHLYTSAAWQKSEVPATADAKATIFNAGIRHRF